MEQTYKRFLQKLQQNMLKLGITPGHEKILVACSGGMDSTALVLALNACKYKIHVAHVNYKLRSAESDANEAFVAGLCNSLNIPCYAASFDLKKMLEAKQGNLQELARELRYQWFMEQLKENDLDFIATAHHLDDQAETMFQHFIRGSGLKGLSGIAVQRGMIIRPFLNFTREEIQKISTERNWSFSLDSSNEKNDYSRNFIRNQVIPLIRTINPNISETLGKQAGLYREMDTFFQWTVDKILQELIEPLDPDAEELDIQKLRTIPGYRVLLLEYVRKFGFTMDESHQIAAAIESGSSGLMLSSKSHKLLVDRSKLKLSAINIPSSPHILKWKNEYKQIALSQELILIKSLDEPKHVKAIDKIPLDNQLLKQDLFLRHWKNGDVFFPKGMNGKRKKVSDFFIDLKIDRFEKDKIWLLMNEKDEIIWIVGLRSDQRFVPASNQLLFWIYLENTNYNSEIKNEISPQ